MLKVKSKSGESNFGLRAAAKLTSPSPVHYSAQSSSALSQIQNVEVHFVPKSHATWVT